MSRYKTWLAGIQVGDTVRVNRAFDTVYVGTVAKRTAGSIVVTCDPSSETTFEPKNFDAETGKSSSKEYYLSEYVVDRIK